MRRIKVTRHKKYLHIEGIVDITNIRRVEGVSGSEIETYRTTRPLLIKITQPEAHDLFTKLRRYLYV